MKRKSNFVNRVELLIVLNYLFKYTNEKYPATCPLICKYATRFGVKYDPTQKVGNEINRHRISSILHFLYSFSNTHKEILPFEIKRTDGGKYYASKRNDISLQEVIAIVNSINTNKILSNEEKESLNNKIKKIALSKYDIDSFEVIHNPPISYRKHSKEYTIKLRLLIRALREEKLIHIYKRRNIFDDELNEWKSIKEPLWCRVYKLKEYQNKLYSILVGVDGKTYSLPIERIELTSYNKKEVLMSIDKKVDEIDDRLKNSRYDSMGELMSDNKILIGDAAIAVPFVFAFDIEHLDKFKESFEDYFSIELKYSVYNKSEFTSLYGESLFEEYKENTQFALVDIKLNGKGFLLWVSNNYVIAKEIIIIRPKTFNRTLARYFETLNNKYSKYKEM